MNLKKVRIHLLYLFLMILSVSVLFKVGLVLSATSDKSNEGLNINYNREEFIKSLLRDPFEPYERPAPPGAIKRNPARAANQQGSEGIEVKPAFAYEEYRVSAVIYEPMQPMTIINDSILYKGDIIKGAKIFAINPGEVVLEKEGQLYTIKITN